MRVLRKCLFADAARCCRPPGEARAVRKWRKVEAEVYTNRRLNGTHDILEVREAVRYWLIEIDTAMNV